MGIGRPARESAPARREALRSSVAAIRRPRCAGQRHRERNVLALVECRSGAGRQPRRPLGSHRRAEPGARPVVATDATSRRSALRRVSADPSPRPCWQRNAQNGRARSIGQPWTRLRRTANHLRWSSHSLPRSAHLRPAGPRPSSPPPRRRIRKCGCHRRVRPLVDHR